MRTPSFAAITLLTAGLLPAATPALATAATACDSLWVAYNNCLVGSDNYFEKKLCDIEFLISMTACRRMEQ